MTYDSDDDLFNEEFDFVDEDELDSELEDSQLEGDEIEAAEDKIIEEAKKPKEKATSKRKPRSAKTKERTPREGNRKPKPRGTQKPQRDGVQAKASKNVDEKPESAANNDADDSAAKEAQPKETTPPKPVGPPTDHVVHLYEFGEYTRTIPRGFTNDDANAFAKEYNRTSNSHSRSAVALGKDEERPISVSRSREVSNK